MPFDTIQAWLPSWKRQSSKCTNGPYTATNGLTFEKYCGKQYSGPAKILGSGVKDSLDDCMDICSVSRPRCSMVNFNTANGTCTLFGFGTFLDVSYLSASPSVDLAIANASQLASPPPIDIGCPYLDSSYQTSSSGEEFVIYCNVDFYGYGDYCPYSLGPLGCPPHADTMADCMEICSEVHPLCKGVSWNPDMKPGYGNCYLKDDITDGNPSPPRGNYTIHSAGVTPSYADVSVGCPPDRSYTSINDMNFTIDCYDGRIGSDNFTSVHEKSIYDCMETCSTQDSKGCKAVVFDDSMLEGYENCYLLNSTGSPNKGTNATFAELSGNKHSGPIPSSKNKAWIAGPVIGAVAFLVLLAIGFRYWHRRRSQSRKNDGEHVPQQPQLDEDKPQFSTAVSELKGDTNQQVSKPHELQTPTKRTELTGDPNLERHELNDPSGEKSRHELEG